MPCYYLKDMLIPMKNILFFISLTPNGISATFMQYFNVSGLVAPKSKPVFVYAQQLWTFTSKDKATVQIFAWYPSNSADNADTAIWGYQGSAIVS